MDFLQKIVLPQSYHHMELLRNLLILTFLIFLPYLSVLFGSLLMSLFFKKRGLKNNSKNDLRFSKNLIDTVTQTKSMAIAFGIIPLLSIIFCYAQLLSGTEINVKIASYLLSGTIFFTIAAVFIYTYKYSFHLKDILGAVKDKDIDENLINEVEEYKSRASVLFGKTGFWGLFFLIVSLFFVLGSIQTASDPESWSGVKTFLNVVFSIKTFAYVILFILLSISVSSATVLFLNFRPNSSAVFESDEEKEFLKRNLLYSGLFSSILLPPFFVLSVFVVSNLSVNEMLFGITAVVVLLSVLVTTLYYIMLRDEKDFSSSLIFLYVVLFLFAVIKDQAAFQQGTEHQFNVLAKEYQVFEKELKASMGLETETISGADIYNGRCIACHKFDKVLVGPAYNDVLVKYEGKMDDLVKFILNPVKINPKFTEMPNQGLKPKEAEAVAEYIMSVFKSGAKK